MGLDMSVAMEDGVQDDVRALLSCAGGDVKDVVFGRRASIDQDLGSVDGEVGGLCGSDECDALGYVDLLDGDSAGVVVEVYRSGGVEDAKVANPAVLNALHLDSVEVLVVEGDFACGCKDSEVLDANLFYLAGVGDFCDGRSVLSEVFGVVGVGERHVEDKGLGLYLGNAALDLDVAAYPGFFLAVADEGVHSHEMDPV